MTLHLGSGACVLECYVKTNGVCPTTSVSRCATTCRDAKDSFRVIVPHEAVGEHCELLHEVNLFDFDIDLADIMPVAEVMKPWGNV